MRTAVLSLALALGFTLGCDATVEPTASPKPSAPTDETTSAAPSASDAGGSGPFDDGGASDAGALEGSPPRLVVSGEKILDPSGAPIVLRGYNWGQWGTAQPNDAADNAAQGASSVRIPLRWWGDWKPGVDCKDSASPGHIEPGHLALLDQTIAWAVSQKLWVVLFVDSNYGQGANGATDNFWTDAAMKQEFVEVWQFLVRRYGSLPYIGAWEILPEPHAVDVTDAQVKDFYDSIIPVIRAIDPKTPIVVGPNDSYNLHRLEASFTTIDPNLIYTGDYFIFDNTLGRLPQIDAFVAKHHAPVWINQVGIQSGDSDAQTKARDVLGALRTRGVGFAWWTYREQATNPKTHGIYYLDPSNPTAWLVKPEWLALVGDYLK